MTSVKVGNRRLRRLAEPLLKGKLGHKKFDFETFNAGELNRKGCGTVGCALGECPIVFPRDWQFNSRSWFSLPDPEPMPALRAEGVYGMSMGFDAAEAYFALPPANDITSTSDSEGLFAPDTALKQLGEEHGLPGTSTRRQVAWRILRYVKWREAAKRP